MLTKLALRNVRRQIGNYLVYFITVSTTVALMFSVNNVIYSKLLQDYAANIATVSQSLTGISVFISIVVAFVLGYATNFMLRLRRREFGAYLTLGMTRKDVIKVFLTETFLLSVTAIVSGVVLGLFLYQGLMALVAGIIEVQPSFAGYSLKGFTLTVELVLAMFVFSSISSAHYLRKVSIVRLINADDASRGSVKMPGLWCAIALVCGAATVLLALKCWDMLGLIMSGEDEGITLIYYFIAASVFFGAFHATLARGLMGLSLQSKRLKTRGTAIFTIRQLSSRLSSNAVMIGILSVLLALSMGGANMSFTQKVSGQAELQRDYPFDIMASLPIETGAENVEPGEAFQRIETDKAEEIISKYTEIVWTHPFDLYNSPEGQLTKHTQWANYAESGLGDSFIRESDFNALMEKLGLDTITLNGEYLVLGNDSQAMNEDFSEVSVVLNGKEYRCAGLTDKYPVLSYAYFLTVIPDEAVNGMDIELNCEAMDLNDTEFDALAMQNELTWAQKTNEDFYITMCNYEIREFVRLEINGSSAVFTIGELYISIVFMLMAIAMLSLKTLSSLSADKIRFETLYRLGVSERGQGKTLFSQTFVFFMFPFILPLLVNIPVSLFCSEIVKASGYSAYIGKIRTCSIGIALTALAAYVLYFTATYIVARRNVVRAYFG